MIYLKHANVKILKVNLVNVKLNVVQKLHLETIGLAGEKEDIIKEIEFIEFYKYYKNSL